jgi:hypothetical protein
MITSEKIARGILLILKYEPKASIAAEHDIIYCGDYNPKILDPQDRNILENELGWFESEDSWARFV